MTESEHTADEDYRCEDCGIEGEYERDCRTCMMNRHLERNKKAYEKMGKI